VTVSVIEAETKALIKEQNVGDRARFEDIARAIFSLPSVQGASHAWSHPFCWMPGRDVEGGRGYERPWLEFADPAIYPAFDLRREIDGSVSYIQDHLMPKGKTLEAYLWSGNCRPSGEALKMVEKLGLVAMNGGNTYVSRRAKGVVSISPKDTFMDGEQQVYTAMQNEFVYTGGWAGPLFGGFRLALDSFRMTEEPRRLKPVNIYYHFYSVQMRVKRH
jgi:polysaccharide biosynthesis protein PelA